ncbi:MAG: ABC-F family ATP-binding cassette domain-containing protein [Polyangiaceae bacterium]
MTAIGIQNLEKSFGARTLFEEVTLTLNEGSRYGLVGANGSGKTTLLRILAGDEPATDGSVSLKKGAKLGVLRQDRFLDDDRDVIDLAMEGDEAVTTALAERAALAAADGDHHVELADLEERLRHLDASTLEARAAEILEGLGIERRTHKRPLRELSGGMKLRVLFAQVLVGRPEILLLDEPTNHLDILSIRWLERFLVGYPGCAIIISHDQRFLDNVATHVLDVDFGTVFLYKGNYSTFERDKTSIIERKEAEVARLEEIVAQKRAFVERFRAKATKARQAQSRLKQIEKIEIEEIKPTSRRAPRIKLEEERASGRDVLKVEGVSKAYGDKRVLTNVGVTIRRGERVAIIGANGLGKSTLVRILAGRLAADGGAVAWGHEARVGYFPQDHKELLTDEKQTLVDYLWQFCRLEGTSFVRGHLGAVLFSGDDAQKKIESLSGGEAARLLFARLSVERPNVLLLDEPTNHLDMEAIQALAESLKKYTGTTIFVSHNRWFVSELATRVIEVRADGLVDFPGTYDEYLDRCGDDHLDTASVLARKKAESAAAAAPVKNVDWEDQKKRRNRLKVLRDKSAKVTETIATAEDALAAHRARYAEDGFFERTTPAEVEKLHLKERELEAKVEALLVEWEAVETELGELAASLGEPAS